MIQEYEQFNTDEICGPNGAAASRNGTGVPHRHDFDKHALSSGLKMQIIERNFREIMQVLGLDLTDASLKKTPHRVAKMFVKEIFSGLNPDNKPEIALFENNFDYTEMLVEKNVDVYSICEHHFLPIIGKAHVAYIPNGQVIGLSKIHRIVNYVARRPQVQERLTIDIANELKLVLAIEDVAVVLEADHLCVAFRGVQDAHSQTVTRCFSGRFQESPMREEFLRQIPLL